MTAEHVFQLLNLVVLPWWLLWIAAPRSAWSLRAASHSAVFLALCIVYAVLLGIALASAPAGGAGFGFDAMREGLSTPRGFLAGWSHYVVFDLFVGAWIVREANRLDVDARLYLPFTLMMGPVGLAAFLVRRAARLRTLGQLGQIDLV